MSLHGRVYVDKNLALEKHRERTMKSHINKLNLINGTNPKRFKEVTRSSDMKLKYHNAIRQ